MSRGRVWVATLTLSAGLLCSWMVSEGFSPTPYVPTPGDVPTIGHGSTHYEDGRPVRLGDPPINRRRAAQLARNLLEQDERQFQRSLGPVELYQEEYDLYLDFVGQFGMANWLRSSMRRHLLAGQYRLACDALLKWRMQAGRDCSQPQNWGPSGCKGVWTRQLERHARCVAAQPGEMAWVM